MEHTKAISYPSSRRKPVVAIVGRPNVGKSTLFNRIVGWQKSIVEDIPGVTRDRIYADVEWHGIQFSLIDTGGYEPVSEDIHFSLIKSQVEKAIEEADLILFVLDGKTGIMPQDHDILKILRKTAKPVLYVVNKIDHENHESRALDFHALGIADLITVSATQGRRINELLDAIVENLPEPKSDHIKEEQTDEIRIAIIGKPNVGKSTLINTILGQERLITSPIPGTTRDAVDIAVEINHKRYVFIDTAGIRRKSRIKLPLERYSVSRAIRSIDKADIVLLMNDSQEGPTHQDARLAELIRKRGKGCIVILNKWDLAPKHIGDIPSTDIEEMVRERLKAIDFAPVLRISALKGQGIDRVFDTIDRVYANFTKRIPTKSLNRFLKRILETNPPPIYRGKEIKFYYISQPITKPPTFVVFTNSIKGIPESYKRFLENRLREEYKLEGTPIRFIFRARK
ncbi:MAG: GTPase Der [Deltaproteobacteria bacterium]|jgi:GTP-binding protein|nr:MAG: GTPase Der [Deltaproteobacteria bacterium]